MIETVHQAPWCAELYQARAAAEYARAQVAAVSALAAAVDRCRDLVAVVDDQQKILVSICLSEVKSPAVKSRGTLSV